MLTDSWSVLPGYSEVAFTSSGREARTTSGCRSMPSLLLIVSFLLWDVPICFSQGTEFICPERYACVFSYCMMGAALVELCTPPTALAGHFSRRNPV